MTGEINATNAQLINELRERGLYVLALGPKDFSEYELEDGTVEMTEAEAMQLVARATKVMDNVLMEPVWEVVGSIVSQFKKEKGKPTEAG